MTSAQAVVSLASAVSSASFRRFPRTFPRNRFMPASAPAPGPEITMLELAVPHPPPRRPPPHSAPALAVAPPPHVSAILVRISHQVPQWFQRSIDPPCHRGAGPAMLV